MQELGKFNLKINFITNGLKKYISFTFNNKTEGTGLKILSPKQMLQRLSIALSKVKAVNNSESLLNEIRQIVHSLYQSKQITKSVYSHIIKSIQ